MDEGKILIVNLSRGLVGEDNAAILGSLFVTKIQLAAMSRADIPRIEDRKPFYLYVDEFQNFATDSFAVILSEARKYGLNLTVANQYISQMAEPVRDAVFGNVGSMISFRVSPDDSPFLVKYFEPQFEAADLSQFHNRHFVASLSINGEKVTPFSATTLNIPDVAKDNSLEIIANSRQVYAADKSAVETHIREVALARGDNTPKDLNQSTVKPASGTDSQTQQQIEAAPKLSESQKRRLRRKRAAEASKVAVDAKVAMNGAETDTNNSNNKKAKVINTNSHLNDKSKTSATAEPTNPIQNIKSKDKNDPPSVKVTSKLKNVLAVTVLKSMNDIDKPKHTPAAKSKATVSNDTNKNSAQKPKKQGSNIIKADSGEEKAKDERNKKSETVINLNPNKEDQDDTVIYLR